MLLTARRGLALGILLSATWASSHAFAEIRDDRDEQGKPVRKSVFAVKGAQERRGRPHAPAVTGNGINYNGGPVMTGTVNVYYIWYGSWSANSVSILQNLARNIGGSRYYNINTTYSVPPGQTISNSVNWGLAATDNYSRGKRLSDSAVFRVVSSAISSGKLPRDPQGVYFVLTSQDVNETSGFCTRYCAWHTYGSVSGTNIKYAFVGNAERCLPACAEQSTSPNANPGADAMASLVAHELEETVTDPNLNAWYDSNGYENADKCAWTYGNSQPASNGSLYNLTLGGYQYLIQQNWVNAGGGYCAMSY